MNSETDRIKRLMRNGLDQAFQQQIGHLYNIWLSNPHDLEGAGQRAAIGARNAIEVYQRAMLAIDQLELDDGNKI